MKKYKHNEIIYCCNCGKKGHNFKKCLSPVLSYGIILFEKKDGDINYLMVQRKDTIGFIEFMRGKYNINNIPYISKLFKIMTQKEREMIIEYDFDTLWSKLWNVTINVNSTINNEYKESYIKFTKLKNGFIINNNFISLIEINKIFPYIYKEPEWGFPKGRRNLFETDVKCAIREFSEETNLDESDYNIIDYNKKFIETFHGTNNVKYRHVYYLAELQQKVNLTINKNNINQAAEIGAIKWFMFEDAYNSIRPYNYEKKKVLRYINNYLTN
jgi:8-oxo-dGTP pyrophosphatase MutT (NUDIX family)